MLQPKQIRNITIVAHIDHGKTTLLDSLLKQSNLFRDCEQIPERVMDCYDKEKERGITIFLNTLLFITKIIKLILSIHLAMLTFQEK